MNWFRQLVQRALPKGSFRFNVGVLAGGTALSQAAMLAFVPLLTRLYSAEDFGYLQVYLSISIFLINAASLRYETAVLLPKEDSLAANVFALAATTTLLLTTLCAMVISMILWTLPVGSNELRLCVAFLPVSMAGAATNQVLVSWFLRTEGYHWVAGTKVRQILVMLVTQVLLGYFGCGVIGLLVGDALGKATGILRLARAAWRENGTLLRQVRPSAMWQAAIRYAKFPLLSTGATLINTAGFAVPTLMIGAWYGPQVLGWFGHAERVILAPSSLIGIAVTQVAGATAARLAHSSPESLPRFFLRTARVLLLLALPIGGLLAVAAPWMFALVFSEDWREAGVYARSLSATMVIGFVAGGLTQMLTVLERQSLQLGWDSARMAITCGVLYSVHVLEGSARTAIFAYAMSLVVTYVALLGLSYLAVLQHARRAAPPGDSPLDPTPSESTVSGTI